MQQMLDQEIIYSIYNIVRGVRNHTGVFEPGFACIGYSSGYGFIPGQVWECHTYFPVIPCPEVRYNEGQVPCCEAQDRRTKARRCIVPKGSRGTNGGEHGVTLFC
jgi:hypothetical protein